MVAEQQHTKDILKRLCHLAESLLPNSVASIMLLDPNTKLLNIKCAPSIPQVGIDTLKNLRPCPKSGSCGNAVFKNKPQFVQNTFTDERWENLRQLAYDFNLCSCWSMPIKNQNKEAIGSFALSSFEHRAPNSFQKKLLEVASSIVTIVLKNQDNEERLKLNSEAIENALDGMVVTDLNNNIIETNQAFESTYGYTLKDLEGKNPSVLASKYYDKKFLQKHVENYS